MNRYVIRFAIANLVLTAVLAVVAVALNLKAGSWIAIAAAIGSSLFAAAAFAKDHSREPTAAEKAAFAWRALLATWLVSLVLAGTMLVFFSSTGELKEVGRFLRSGSALVLLAGSVLVVSAVYYAGIRWSFGWYTRLAAGRKR